MQNKKSKLKILFLAIIFSFIINIFWGTGTHALVYFQDDFDSYTDIADAVNGNWNIGSQWLFSQNDGRNGTPCLIVHANIEHGTAEYACQHDINPLGYFAEGYIRFYYKIVNHDGNLFGTKFLKLHGEINSTSYANYTFQFNTESVITGDGSGLSNDSSCGWRWGGQTLPNCTYDFFSNNSTNPPNRNDESWHLFEAYVKENTDGNYDGEIRVWFDEVNYLTATGIRMRNDSNIRNIAFFNLFAYAYMDVNTDSDDDYYMYFDDVIISDIYNGPENSSSDTTSPSAPSGLSVS